MQLQEWLRSLCSHAGLKGSEAEELWSLLPSLSTSSLLGLGALASLTVYWLLTRPQPVRPPCDLQAQSVAVGGDPSCRRSALLKDDNLLEFYYDDIRTVYEMFQRGLRISGDGPCLGYRKPGQPYEWISYSEWVISEMACYTYSMALVPLYDTLGTEAMVHILNLAEMSLVVCDREERAALLLECKEKGMTPKVSCLGFLLSKPESRSHIFRCLPQLPQPQDLAVVCFTSGTTGTFAHLSSCPLSGFVCDPARGRVDLLPASCPHVREDDPGSLTSFNIVSFFLCLPQINPFPSQLTMYCYGARVGFFQGDVSLLMDDIKTLKPTLFPVVPRILNRIYDKILGSVTSPLQGALLHYAVGRKQAELCRGIVRNNSLWDKLVFKKIQASLGGNLRFALTASAPISCTVLSFLRATMGCMICEGYGQTECTGGCTFSLIGDSSTGHVGAPLPCAMVKVVDIPDMNYFAKNGEGEICIRGPSVFKGYLKDPERTAEALDSDGWLHTGDVGQWLPNGTLRIIDRKKHIFKLCQGEYVAPEKIENVYMRSVPVLQVFVHGDSLQSYVVGIVVPDREVFVEWAKERAFVGSYQELCHNPDVKNAVLEDMRAVGKEAGLKSFEQVKELYLHPEMFSIANGLLTPTLKSRRADIRRVFQEQLANMYKTPI
uniref:Arachidonate--CoA ligase n=1 Tax=Xiphophorus couchianus TaxID=32473 RepID=A0A3B5MEI6_9TELE